MNKIGVLCIVIAIFAVCHVKANPLKQDAANYQNCKNLCGLCKCVGFYCGDECICECHHKVDENVNCIDDMQNNCEKSGAPFEVLIQGPSGSRFIRSLVLADVDAPVVPVDPKDVSTISVFQPNDHIKLVKRDIEADVAEALADSANADAATIDERTTVDVAPASDSARSGTEEKVGLALPIAPILGLKALPFQLKALNLGLLGQNLGIGKFLGVQGLLNPGLNPITNPVLNPIVNPGIIPAKIAALKAKVGLGLLPIAGGIL